MKFTKDAILHKLGDLPVSEDLAIARAFLSSPAAVQFDPLIAGKLSVDRIIRPRDIIKTWDARCENALRKGFKLAGCADLVRRLKSIPDATELVSVVFKSDEITGLFWFDRNSDEPVGFVIADRAEAQKT